MTAKYFIAIARILKDAKHIEHAPNMHQRITMELIKLFELDNPLFDSVRFLEAITGETDHSRNCASIPYRQLAIKAADWHSHAFRVDQYVYEVTNSEGATVYYRRHKPMNIGKLIHELKLGD